MTYEEAVRYIESYTWSPDRIGLYRIQELLNRLGDPQKGLKFVHVAGSNGKGSTCAMLAEILTRSGLRTGLFTSPHLVRFEERMQIDGQMIPGEELADILEQVRDEAEQMDEHPSQFELSTAIGMVWFARKQCDVVVLEVGMGGTFDSTNVIDSPEVAVITHIGLEHTEFLGNTLAMIASAKAGIIKEGTTAVCYSQEAEVMDVIRETCRERRADFEEADASRAVVTAHDLTGQTFEWENGQYRLSLLGEHQTANAVTALTCIKVLRRKGWKIPEDAVHAGLEGVKWPARFEVLHTDPVFIVDGGHNPQCAQAIARNIRQYLPGEKVTFLTGVLADKDYNTMLGYILPLAASFVCVTPDSPRAMQAEELAGRIRDMGVPAVACPGIGEAAKLLVKRGDPHVLCFGSLYMAGEAREAILEQFGG